MDDSPDSPVIGAKKNGAPERMEIVAGTSFDVPGQSGFTIEVSAGLCEYFCLFL